MTQRLPPWLLEPLEAQVLEPQEAEAIYRHSHLPIALRPAMTPELDQALVKLYLWDSNPDLVPGSSSRLQ